MIPKWRIYYRFIDKEQVKFSVNPDYDLDQFVESIHGKVTWQIWEFTTSIKI